MIVLRSIVLLLILACGFSADMPTTRADSKQNARAKVVSILTTNRERTTAVQAGVSALVSKYALTAIDSATFGFLAAANGDNMVAITSGTKNLTSATARWVLSDAGRTIHIQGAGVAGGTLTTTIAAYVSAGAVTLTDAASTTVAPTATSAGGIAVWGDPVALTLAGDPLKSGTSSLYPQVLDLSNLPNALVTATGSTTARTLAARAAEVFNVLDYGAKADGTTDDGPAITAACNAANMAGGGEVRFPAGKTLRIFSVGTVYSYLGAFNLCNGIFLNGNGCTLQIDPARVWVASYGYIFQFTQCNMWKVDGFTVTGPAQDVSTTDVKGVEFVHCGQLCTNGSMPYNSVTGVLAGFIAQRGSAGQPTGRNLHIGVLNVKNSWYGFNVQWEMEGVVIDLLNTEDVHRSYFVYGARNHRVSIVSKDHKANNVQLSAAGSMGCENLDIKYTNINSTAASDGGRHVAMYVDETAGVMRNIKLELDIFYVPAANSGAGAFIVEHVLSNGNPDTLGRGRVIENLQISGKVSGQSHYNEPTFQSYTLGTYTSGDYWRNWSFRNLRLENTRGFYFVLDSLDGDFTLENVQSDVELDLHIQGASYDSGPARGRVQVLGGYFPNRYGYVTAQGLDVVTDGNAAVTVRTGHQGRTFSNRLSGSNQVYSLPESALGLRFTFIRFGAVNMDIDPNGTDTILGGGAGKMLYLRNSGNVVTLECTSAGYWQIINQVGTVTFEP